MSREAFRQLMEDGDVAGLRAAWGKISPHLPQPGSHEQAEIVMHAARTAAETVSFPKRAYSHRWLTERELPSQLPDRLKPSAERLYPRIAEAVGISVNMNREYMRPAIVEVRGAMEDAVQDAFAENRRDPVFVSARMKEAKSRAMKALFGRWSPAR